MTLKVEAYLGGYVDGTKNKFPVIVREGEEIVVSQFHPESFSYTPYTLVGLTEGGYIKGNDVYPKKNHPLKKGQSTQLGVFRIIGS